MKIEVLYPEIANLYGDLENITYLQKSNPEIEVVETHLTDVPLFVSEKPALVYMGTMTERAQILVIEALKKAGRLDLIGTSPGCLVRPDPVFDDRQCARNFWKPHRRRGRHLCRVSGIVSDGGQA